ncbi:MAG: HAD hydrolase-like protein, partial [Gaiellaceae bacterium]
MGLVFEHVVFDLDGTLIDSRADLSAAVNHVLQTFGLPELPQETVCKYVGEGARVLVE